MHPLKQTHRSRAALRASCLINPLAGQCVTQTFRMGRLAKICVSQSVGVASSGLRSLPNQN